MGRHGKENTPTIKVTEVILTEKQRASLTVDAGVKITGQGPEKYAYDLKNQPKTW